MPVSKDDISGLVNLQKHDECLDSLNKSLALIPEDIAALKVEVEKEKARLDEVHEKAKQIEVLKKEKELGMTEQEEAIKKHQTELNAVKTNEAFKALLKEIEGEKTAVGDFETEILTLMEETDAVKKEEMAVKGDLKRYEAENSEQVKILEKRKSELETELAVAVEKRASLTGNLPPELLALYDRTRERRGGIAISRAEGDICTACNMKIPPQSVIDLAKGSKIVLCNSCQRILYHSSLTASKPA